jgi:serine phosphatase RsbU (regulator of sigma subunit)/anti-sigma regulatory factor (Ser/Thr protein kinase)
VARLRERFLEGEPVTTGVRGVILASWQRCQSLGLSPDVREPSLRAFEAETRLTLAAAPVLDRLAVEFAGTEVTVSLADENGTLLQQRGEPSLAHPGLNQSEEPGLNMAERFAGTSGVAVALAEGRPAFVFGSEHYLQQQQLIVCLSSPLRDQLSGRIEGILDFGCPVPRADQRLEALMRESVAAIERRLLEDSSTRERALLGAYRRARRRARLAQAAAHWSLTDPEGRDEGDLGWRDQMILKERAAELISAAQRAAIEVPLPGGRLVTLLSRPLISPSGVRGVAVEALQLTGPPEHTFSTAGPSTITTAGRGPLVMVGEPEAGKFAVAARHRLELLSEASVRIGTTLDVTETARELAEIVVPRLADSITIDLSDAVLRGEEPAAPGTDLRRTVVHGTRNDHFFDPVGQQVALAPNSPQAHCLTSGQSVLENDLATAVGGWFPSSAERGQPRGEQRVHSLVVVPLSARGVLLGIANLYRARTPAPFGDDDRSLAEELAARAALCIDNARRYTREHAMVLTLQRSLLPHGTPEQSAVEVAHRYLPAQGGVGGDWFDVIPLSGARVALIVGDVVGHGMHAAATMGRLRTAVHNFSALDLAPDELLTHLDDLVQAIDQDVCTDETTIPLTGATCLYAIYDPTTRRCTVARAGHPPPAVVYPDGTVTLLDLPPGPPLGLGGLPFGTVDLDLPEGSQLVLYTDGLIEGRHRDPETALDELRRALSHPDRPAEDTCRAVADAVLPADREDDVTVLVARTRTLDPRRIAGWELAADPGLVAGTRAAAMSKLAEWGLEDVAFTTELILSELVTNAIRYGAGPIEVRLLLDRSLICEVSDTSSTAPHLRHAALTDEGGRGLFLIAQLAERWGTRYTSRGKTIWTEQTLTSAEV